MGKLSALHKAGTLVRLLGAALLISAYLWHLTDAAWELPVARTFGWFYKFLTFWALTLQCIQYSLAGVVFITGTKGRSTWLPLLDDVACLAFTAACAVTILFYTLQLVTKGGVQAAVKPPDWISYAVHMFNSMFAVVDIVLAEQRSFSRRSQKMCGAFVVAYATWIWVIKHQVGEFPYPFLNKVPQPAGFFATAAASLVAFGIIFTLGSQLSRFSSYALGKRHSVYSVPSKKKAT